MTWIDGSTGEKSIPIKTGMEYKDFATIAIYYEMNIELKIWYYEIWNGFWQYNLYLKEFKGEIGFMIKLAREILRIQIFNNWKFLLLGMFQFCRHFQ